jgi:hypothetical protein
MAMLDIRVSHGGPRVSVQEEVNGSTLQNMMSSIA